MTSPPRWTLQIAHTARGLQIVLSGVIDDDAARFLEARVRRTLRAPCHTIVQLDRVERIDGAALRYLMALQAYVERSGLRFRMETAHSAAAPAPAGPPSLPRTQTLKPGLGSVGSAGSVVALPA